MQEIKLRIVKFFMNKHISPENKKEKFKIFSHYFHPDKTQQDILFSREMFQFL
jgi:hypothetical protein